MCRIGDPCSNKSPPAKQLQHRLPKFPFLCVLLFSDSFPDGWDTTQWLWPVRSVLIANAYSVSWHFSEITNNWETLESCWSFWNLKAQYCCSVSLHQENQFLDLVPHLKTERYWGYCNCKQKISFFILLFVCWVQMLLVCFSFACRKG